jgi:membrane-associated phospholipid phosphatase
VLRAADLAILRLLRTRGHGRRVERVVQLYSHAGEHGALWHALAVLGLLADPRSRRTYLHAIRCVLAAYAVNTGLKYLFRRARPVLEELPWLAPTVSGHSYPSAHAAMSFAGARVLSQALPPPPLYAAATAMAASRPYLGVHYPTDVLAGAALGEAVARLTP